ncbi:MAG TPA: hypothetical protein VG101_18715 [Puia sp.]|jgi:hypothetical protein|nr:hypothetical protein [Puia sp.]
MSIILLLHSLLRWVILILLLAAILQSYSGMNSGRPFSRGDRKLGLYLLISAHTTFLLGLVLWLFGPFGLALARDNGMGAVMKNAVMRYWVVEHFFGMLIAIVLITVGRGVAKKNIPDGAKFKRAFWLFLVALIIILVTIPWPFRAGVGRAWL